MDLIPPPSQLIEISDGVAGVVETLDYMRDYVRTFKKNPYIRNLALRIAQGPAQKNWIGQIYTLFDWVQQNITYVMDINGVETLQDPIATLQLGAGDCDDKVTLLCALLEAVGHPTRLIALSFTPGLFDHVIAATQIADKKTWLFLDPTENQPAGWLPPGILDTLVRDN